MKQENKMQTIISVIRIILLLDVPRIRANKSTIIDDSIAYSCLPEVPYFLMIMFNLGQLLWFYLQRSWNHKSSPDWLDMSHWFMITHFHSPLIYCVLTTPKFAPYFQTSLSCLKPYWLSPVTQVLLYQRQPPPQLPAAFQVYCVSVRVQTKGHQPESLTLLLVPQLHPDILPLSVFVKFSIIWLFWLLQYFSNIN